MFARAYPVSLALLAAVGLTACSVVSRLAAGHIDIEQSELQARIAPRFPAHACRVVVACLDLSNPAILLQEGDDRIRFSADVKVALGSRVKTGRVGLAGLPRYSQEAGQLFLDDLQITTLELSGFPEEAAELVRAYGAKAARQALQTHPVYTLDGATSKGALAKRAVRGVKVVDGRLRILFAGAAE
jgi:hypothetical protein